MNLIAFSAHSPVDEDEDFVSQCSFRNIVVTGLDNAERAKASAFDEFAVQLSGAIDLSRDVHRLIESIRTAGQS
jgi:hypothetical protein